MGGGGPVPAGDVQGGGPARRAERGPGAGPAAAAAGAARLGRGCGGDDDGGAGIRVQDVAVHAGGPSLHGPVCASGAGMPPAGAVRVHGVVVDVGGVRVVPGGAADPEGSEQERPGVADADRMVARVPGGSVLGGEDEARSNGTVEGNSEGNVIRMAVLADDMLNGCDGFQT
jgi:hypothetical protein